MLAEVPVPNTLKLILLEETAFTQRSTRLLCAAHFITVQNNIASTNTCLPLLNYFTDLMDVPSVRKKLKVS